ncbi:MAG: hypothetical protein RLZZ182_792, partial [Pseudomonadota bacterium]
MSRSTAFFRTPLTALAAAAVLTACGTTPLPPSATVEVPAAYSEAAAAQARWKTAQPAEVQPRGAWWQAFQDPTLN